MTHTETGEQPKPTGTAAPWTTTPRLESSDEAAGVSDCSVLSQHCTLPVSHCAKAAVAAARMVKMVSLENMMLRVAELERFVRLRISTRLPSGFIGESA